MITITRDSIWPRGSEHGDTTAPSLVSIGVGLGRTVRFAGQTREFYTVLLHTLTVADLVHLEHRIYALLHDAAEAIVGDVTSTWKTDAARAHEADLLERITRTLNLPWPWPDAATTAVKEADLRALAAEAHVLGHTEAAKLWPEPDAAALALTAGRVSHALRYLDADAAGYLYLSEVSRARRHATAATPTDTPAI